MNKFKPGETSPKTCVANMCNKNGEVINTVEIQAGQSFPPAPESGCYYEVE